jgi:SAM-dependent MidA family methyltransferase
VEVCAEAAVVMEELAERLSDDGGMALIADYGHTGDKSDTFRVRVLVLLISYALYLLCDIVMHCTCYVTLLCTVLAV